MSAESVAASIVASSGGEAQDGSHGGRTLGGQEPQILQDEPVSQLEMIEAQLLSHASLEDFRVVGAPRQVGDVSAVLEATCGLPGLPRPMKRFALKVMAAFKSNEGEADDGFGSSIPSSIYQQFPSVPPTLVREWFLSNTLPPHPNVARTVRIGSYDLSGFDGLQLAEAIGSEELRRVATADKVRATKGKKSLSASLVSVLQSLPSAIKATVGKALADHLVNDGKESDVPTSSTALPGLAFAVSDCATASLGSIRHSLPQPLPFQVLFPIALQLSRALAHVNNYRVAHRDLHPGNVLVFPGTLGNNATGSAMLGGGVEVSVASSSSSSAGSTTTTITNTAGSSSPIPRYCLADFGSAVKLEGDSMSLPYQHHSQPIGGALAFLPPEVLVAAAKGAAATGWKPSSGTNSAAFAVNGKKVTSIPYGKSDVWGLGALLYSIAFGSHPWPGEFSSCIC
jgi:serine/threonine protein kinase